MKKIITLLFFAGCLTTGFAQSGHRQQNNNKSSGIGYQSHQNSGNNTDQYPQNSHYSNGRYRDNEQNSRNTENDYGYNKENDNQGRRETRGDQSYRSWSRDSWHQKRNSDDNRD